MKTIRYVVAASLCMAATLQAQTVSSHSSLRIPTPAIDREDRGVEPVRPATAEVRASTSNSARSRTIDAASSSSEAFGLRPISDEGGRSATVRKASLVRDASTSTDSRSGEYDDRLSASAPSLPKLRPLDDDGYEAERSARATSDSIASVSTVSTTSVAPTTYGTTVGSGVQYYGPPAGSGVAPVGYSTPTSTVIPGNSGWTLPESGISQTSYSVGSPSYSVPTSSACCGGSSSAPPVTVGYPPTNYPSTFPTNYPAPTYPSTGYPVSSYPTTVLAPPVSDAAAFPPSLNGSTIPGSYPGSGQAVPYLVNPVAVNIPAVPLDEQVQPVIALRPGVPESSYVGRGILGQPEVYVRGQGLRNAIRYLTLW